MNRTKFNAREATAQEQSTAGKSGGKKKMDSNLIEALWDEVQAHNRMVGLGWKAPEVKNGTL